MADDLLGPNPFPPEDARHSSFEQLRGKSIGDLSAFKARVLAALPPEEADPAEFTNWQVQGVIGLFDLNARYACALIPITDAQTALKLGHVLDQLQLAMLESVRTTMKGKLNLGDLNCTLRQRRELWLSQACSLASELDVSKRNARRKAGDSNGSRPWENQTAEDPKYLGRATWLKERLQERAWTEHDVKRQGGPDIKTVRKMLQGQDVREDVLERLVKVLSKKRGKVDLMDIPRG